MDTDHHHSGFVEPVPVGKLVKPPDCGSGISRFKPERAPNFSLAQLPLQLLQKTF